MPGNIEPENSINSNVESIIIIKEHESKNTEGGDNKHAYQNDIIFEILEESDVTAEKSTSADDYKNIENILNKNEIESIVNISKSNMNKSSTISKDDSEINTTMAIDETPHECPLCKKTYSTKTNLMLHLRTHEGPADCPVYGKTYTYKDSMQQHLLYVHKSTQVAAVCYICGKSYKKSSTYNQHMKRHINKKSFECKICGKHFYNLTVLTRHDRQVHAKIKPFVCEYCSKRFSRRDELKTHLRAHSEDTPFSCKTCGQNLKSKLSLKNHLRILHQIIDLPIVSCDKCKKEFKSEHALQSHNNKMHDKEKCNLCPSIFGTKAYLNKHIQQEHGGK